jgi:hypothetical protein
VGTTVINILPFAVAVAISPIAIIAVILILLSGEARRNGLAFLAGWILGLSIAVIIALVIASLLPAKPLIPGGKREQIASLVKLVLGGALLLLGLRAWRQRQKLSGQAPELPQWLATVESCSASRAFGLAALLAAAGNLTLILAVGLEVARARLGIPQEVGALAIFILIASLMDAAIVCYFFLGHDQAAKTLVGLKTWLVVHNATLTAVALLVVGLILLGKGISGLA